MRSATRTSCGLRMRCLSYHNAMPDIQHMLLYNRITYTGSGSHDALRCMRWRALAGYLDVLSECNQACNKQPRLLGLFVNRQVLILCCR